MSDLFKEVSMGGEQLVVFGSSFASPGFLVEGADLGQVFGAVGEEFDLETNGGGVVCPLPGESFRGSW